MTNVLLYADVSLEVEAPGTHLDDTHCDCHPGECRPVVAVCNVNSDSAPRYDRLLFDFAVCAERLDAIHQLLGVPTGDDLIDDAAQPVHELVRSTLGREND